MRIQTTRFGELDFPEDRIINLPEGVLGFPNDHRFLLLEHDSEGTPFKWLQSADSPQLAFIVMDPHIIVESYRVVLDTEAAGNLGTEEIGEEFAMMAIVNIPHDDPIEMTVNVRAPIIVHTGKRIGWQVILSNEDYPIRHRLFPDEAKTPS